MFWQNVTAWPLLLLLLAGCESLTDAPDRSEPSSERDRQRELHYDWNLPDWQLMVEDIRGPIATHPDDPDIIFVTANHITAGATGMWKSTDGGQSWNRYTDGWTVSQAEDILVHPDHPDTLMVVGNGVSRSTDGGKTWERTLDGLLASSHGWGLKQITYNRRDDEYYLVQDARMHGGVFRSDDGDNWEAMLPINLPKHVLAYNEYNGTIYAGPGPTSGVNLIKSSDGGETWHNIDGPPLAPRHLAPVPGSQTLYATTREGIYKSYDGAETWVDVNDSVTGQLNFSGGLAISETDTNTVFAGATTNILDFQDGEVIDKIDGGLYISHENGESWNRHYSSLPDTLHSHNVHLHLEQQKNSLFASKILSTKPNTYLLFQIPDMLPSSGTTSTRTRR